MAPSRSLDSKAIAVVVKNSSASDPIEVKMAGFWNSCYVGISSYSILPGQEHRFYRRGGYSSTLVITVPNGKKVIKGIKKPTCFDDSQKNGDWKEVLFDTKSSDYQRHLRLAREEWELNSFLLKKRNLYKILCIGKYRATKEEIEAAIDFRLDPYKSLEVFLCATKTYQETENALEDVINDNDSCHGKLYSSRTAAYIAFLFVARRTLLDPKRKENYDRDIVQFFEKNWWKYRGKNFWELPWYWKILSPFLCVSGVAAAVVATIGTCGGTLGIVASVIAGASLNAGLMSLLFATSNGAYTMDVEKRNKGIGLRLFFGSISGGLGGIVTSFVSPLLTASLMNVVWPAAARSINGFVCTWVDGFIMISGRLAAEILGDKKKRSVEEILWKVMVYSTIGALFGALGGYLIHCTEHMPLDETIGALIANKHPTLASLLKSFKITIGPAVVQLKRIRELPNLAIDSVKAKNKIKECKLIVWRI